MIPALRRRRARADERPWSLWSSTLSPFALKVDAICDYTELPHRWMPAEGSRLEGLRALRRVRGITAGRLPLTHPEMSELDEFPLVPFLLGPNGQNLYDSSAIGAWLDANAVVLGAAHASLLPSEDAALRFVIRIVDETFDEFGLYMVHHNRWKVAARDNEAAGRLREDMQPMLGPLARLLAQPFPARQVRRLPYLFSVAPADDTDFDDLPKALRPPARSGFPPTHALLEDAFARILAVLETLLATRPYLFGERFTLADASVYGQLGMNLSDASANAWMQRDAPGVHAWLQRIAHGDFAAHRAEGALALDAAVLPLLAEVRRLFVPLMQQNEAAYERHLAAGEKRFNEAAFDAGRALYDGELDGHPFRSVAKSFQVRVWRSLLSEWNALSALDRSRLHALGLEVALEAPAAPSTAAAESESESESEGQGERAITAGLVRQLIASQFPEWGQLPVEPVENDGWDNRSFRLGAQMLVRLPSAAGYAAQVHKEQRWLPWLAERLPFPIPTPLALGAPAEGYPWHWSVYGWLEGQIASLERIDDPNAFATELGAFLAALQYLDTEDAPPAGEHNYFRGAPLETYDESARRALDALRDRIDTEAATEVWEAALASQWRRRPVWLHGDVAATNLLVRDGKLAAVLDFGCCAVGDPACDTVIAWTFFSPESRAAFRAALPLDDETWARGRGWALWKALILMAGHTQSRPEEAARAAHTLEAVLADHAAAR